LITDHVGGQGARVASLELVVALGLAVLVGTGVAQRVHVPPPAVLLVVGIVLGLVPVLRETHLPPEAVLLLFLPILLYWESFTSSWREIRSNARVVVLLSTVLVVLTAALVAVAAHVLGMDWGPAWVLGAAVAPTDATAVSVLGGMLPRRLSETLRAESLVNDGTALVIYSLAIAVTADGEELTAGRLGTMVLISYGGGIVAGLVVSWVTVQVRRRLQDPAQHALLALVAPLSAYLLAETVEASGVLAAVVCGLRVSRVSPRLFPAAARRHVRTIMSFLSALLNAALFVLVGLEVVSAVANLGGRGLTSGLVVVAAVSAAVVGARFAWLFTSPYLIRLLDRRPQQRRLRLGARPRAVMAAAGFRGAVSLALALAVPQTLASGRPFPDRDLIVFVTAGVIAVTLLLQAPLMPAVVRWARLGSDEQAVERERRRAEMTALQEALDALPGLAEDLGTDEEVADQLRTEYARRLQILSAHDHDEPAEDAVSRERQHVDLRVALLGHKHDTIVRLWERDEIDDSTLQQVQAVFDLERASVEKHRDIT
jgi:monovalent cation:H+ antiporter, CPA1 family